MHEGADSYHRGLAILFLVLLLGSALVLHFLRDVKPLGEQSGTVLTL